MVVLLGIELEELLLDELDEFEEELLLELLEELELLLEELLELLLELEELDELELEELLDELDSLEEELVEDSLLEEELLEEVSLVEDVLSLVVDGLTVLVLVAELFGSPPKVKVHESQPLIAVIAVSAKAKTNNFFLFI